MEAPNGDTIRYCCGWFWVLRTDMIKKCDIPDLRLRDIGGEIAIGEQLRQNGYRIRHFNAGKAMIYNSAQSAVLLKSYPWEGKHDSKDQIDVQRTRD
jgi:GT2 family glycosyltransferase